MTVRKLFEHNSTLVGIYAGNLLLSLHYYLIIYVNSSFLSNFFGSQALSLIYAAGAAVNLFLFLFAARIIRKVGAYHFLLVAAILEGVGVAGLAFTHTALAAVVFFSIHQVIIAMVGFGLDVFLEKATSVEGRTGRIRSTFLTISNATLVIAPAIVGFIVIDNNYTNVYLLSALLMVPLLLVIMSTLSDVHVEAPKHFEVWKSLRALLKHARVRWVTGSELILQTFYSWMVIYTPIYLHQYIGFDWSQIGIMFTIMLLPFIIFEIPVGRLADTRFGEREFMIFGHIVMIVSLFLMALISTPSFLLWTATLFLSRTGASFVEITNESYFFKQVADGDSDWIGLFRSTRSVSYILAPLLAGICITLLPYNMMFNVLAVLTCGGIICAYKLTDTR